MPYLALFSSPSYSMPTAACDVRVFPTVTAAADWLENAHDAHGQYRITSTYADGTTSSDLMPTIDTACTLTLEVQAFGHTLDDCATYMVEQSCTPSHTIGLTRNGRARVVTTGF